MSLCPSSHYNRVPVTSAPTKAALVVTELLQYAPTSDDCVFVKGHSNTKPIAPNDTAEIRAKNRCAEIHIIGDNGQEPTLSVPSQKSRYRRSCQRRARKKIPTRIIAVPSTP